MQARADPVKLLAVGGDSGVPACGCCHDAAALSAKSGLLFGGHGAVSPRGLVWGTMPGTRTTGEWLRMADEARAIASVTFDYLSRHQMIGAAEAYDALARCAALVAVARGHIQAAEERDGPDGSCQKW